MEKQIKQFSLRISKDLMFYLKKTAYKNDISVNDLLIAMIKNHRDENKKVDILKSN